MRPRLPVRPRSTPTRPDGFESIPPKSEHALTRRCSDRSVDVDRGAAPVGKLWSSLGCRSIVRFAEFEKTLARWARIRIDIPKNVLRPVLIYAYLYTWMQDV